MSCFIQELATGLDACSLLALSRCSRSALSVARNSFCVKLALSTLEVTASQGAGIFVSEAREAPRCTTMTYASDSLYVLFYEYNCVHDYQ